MNINNNFTPLAWHQGNIELQSNRASYAFGHVVPLFASNRTLIPFQIITMRGLIDVSDCDVRLCNVDGTDAVGENLWDRMGMKLVWDKYGYDVLVYNGAAIEPVLPIGQYYLTLTSGSYTWYSDVITIVADVDKLTKIAWGNVTDMRFGSGFILYRWVRHGEMFVYQNWMYFMEELGKPEYTVEEEGDTRDGLFYASKILSGKKYKMQVAQLTEAMCDALRFVHLSDYVTVRDGYGRVYNCDSVLVTPEWVNGGAVATAAIEITTDTFVKQLGGGYEGDSPIVPSETGVIGRGIIGVNFVLGVE